jgi:sortase A
VRTTLRGLGETLITFGVVILLFCAYELWFTGLYTARQQNHLRDELRKEWLTGRGEFPHVRLGHGIAVLRIPRLGKGYHPVVVEGVGTEELKKGPGHYPGTALPGQLGNFVVSGHRTTYGHPFYNLDKVKPGDAVILETRNTWYTYRAIRTIIVDPTDVWVIEPTPTPPGEPAPTSAKPRSRLLTFTTCNPRYSASQRLVLQGELEVKQPKADGPPSALQERS